MGGLLKDTAFRTEWESYLKLRWLRALPARVKGHQSPAKKAMANPAGKEGERGEEGEGEGKKKEDKVKNPQCNAIIN